MIKSLPHIKNIIFDLGDVIIDISIHGTIERFAGRSGLSSADVRNIYNTSSVFLDYEKGKISDPEFLEGANRLFGTDMTFEELCEIWNGMLLRIPTERLHLLEKVSAGYRTFLLSNTNDIHLKCFNGMMEAVSPGKPLNNFFEKTYFSHLLGMRKPDAEIFEFVLRENNLNPEETLFLDDNPDNIAGASRLGIHSTIVTNPDILFEIFK